MLFRDVVRAAQLDRSAFQRLAADASRTQGGLAVVVAVAVLSTLGTGAAGLLPDDWFLQPHPQLTLTGALRHGGAHIVGFPLLSGVAYLTAFGLFGVDTGFVAVIRSFGIAYAPMGLGGLVFIPYVGALVSVLSVPWTAATMTVALSAVTRLSTGQAAACVGWAFVLMTIGFYLSGAVPG